MVDDDPLYSAAEAAELIHVLPSTLAGWRCSGRGPRFTKIGKKVFYRQSAMQAWLKAQERDPRNAAAAKAA